MKQKLPVIQVVLTASFAVLLGVASGVARGQSPRPVSDEVKQEIIDRVKGYPDVSVAFENFQGVPVTIESATVKEIGSGEYYRLTGLPGGSPGYTTFPNVRLVNNAGQRIVGLVLVAGNMPTRRLHGVQFNKISIGPDESYSVGAGDWVRRERAVAVASGGTARSRLEPGLDSERMWWPGTAGEMLLRVAVVEFENGTRWVMDPSMDW